MSVLRGPHRWVIALFSLLASLSGAPDAGGAESTRVSVGNQSGLERRSVAGSVFVPIFLSRPVSEPVVVSYFTEDGSASADSDYVAWGTRARPRTVTIPAGAVQTQVNVPVLADQVAEDDETFTVSIASVDGAGATVADDTGVATIVDPGVTAADGPALTVSDPTVVEGDDGQRLAQFLVHLSGPASSSVAISYSTADGSALAGRDYTAKLPGSAVLVPGQISKTIDVPVLADTDAAADRSFELRVVVVGGAPVEELDPVGVATIRDDDAEVDVGPPVVINELLYHPASGDEDDEFLELRNTTGQAIDLSGWCMTQGVTGCFADTTIIGPGAHVVLSPDVARTEQTHGLTPVLAYSGNLSNGGERVTLSDAGGQVVSSVEYDDRSPWPVAADGLGPSLELMDPAAEIDSPDNWRASLVDDGTPGAANSIAAHDPPEIGDVMLSNAAPGQPRVVHAEVEGATLVELEYRVMFGAPVTVAMRDDGLAGDEVAADGRVAATVPAVLDGELVRYRVRATNATGWTTVPSSDESVAYRGYVADDDIDHGVPVLRWYMEPSAFDDMVENHLDDELPFPAVVVWQGEVIDGATVRMKGYAGKQDSKRSFPKKNFKFDLPVGVRIGAPHFDHPVDEFAINGWRLPTAALGGEELAWEAARISGVVPVQAVAVTVARNTDQDAQTSMGLYSLMEVYDGAWRERHDYEQGAFYKEFTSKRTRTDEDRSDVEQFRASLETLQGEQLRTYLLDHVDLPSVINFHALMAVLRNDDWSMDANTCLYLDVDGSGRWSVLPWDLDGVFVPTYAYGVEVSFQPPAGGTSRPLEQAMYRFPEFREMFERRTAELFDDLYGSSDVVEEWSDARLGRVGAAIEDDLDVWRSAYVEHGAPEAPPLVSFGEVFTGSAPELFEQMDLDLIDAITRHDHERVRAAMAAQIAEGSAVAAQPADVGVTLSIRHDPAGAPPRLVIHNDTASAVDVSGWWLEGPLAATLPGGSVIPAGGSATVVALAAEGDRSASSGELVLGAYVTGGDPAEPVRAVREDGSVAAMLGWPG